MLNGADKQARPAVTWVTKAELAAHLHCSTRYVTHLMRRQVVPFVKEHGFLRFNLAECEQALCRRRTARFRGRFPAHIQPTGGTPVPPAQPALEVGESRMFTTVMEARQFLDNLPTAAQGGVEAGGLLVVIARLF